METEIWEFEAGDKSVSKPLLPESTYQHGIALFSVDFEFCKRWVLIKLNECSLRIVFIATAGQDKKLDYRLVLKISSTDRTIMS